MRLTKRSRYSARGLPVSEACHELCELYKANGSIFKDLNLVPNELTDDLIHSIKITIYFSIVLI